MEDDLDRLITWFIKHSRGRLAWGYGCERLVVAPFDTFSNKKSEEDKYIVYGITKDNRILLIKGELYRG